MGLYGRRLGPAVERLSAELRDDGGATASSGEFFRSSGFLAAEGVTHSLLIQGSSAASVAVPVIVRQVEDSALVDAISPYGYPGGEVGAGGSPDPATVDWSAAGLVSLFVRERLSGPHCFTGARARSTVLVHDPALPARTRRRFASQVRGNERRGLAVEAHRGPQTDAAQRAAFHAAYTQTMRRAEAASRYLYEPAYFDAILATDATWLVLAAEPGRGACADAIVVRSDGMLHYYLGGTSDAGLPGSPFKSVVVRMRELAVAADVPLNLGGGVLPGDGLESFKRGFANAELTFHTDEVICDPREYERLAARPIERGGADAAFFPAYRAPG